MVKTTIVTSKVNELVGCYSVISSGEGERNQGWRVIVDLPCRVVEIKATKTDNCCGLDLPSGCAANYCFMY